MKRVNTTHGMSRSATYFVWVNMRSRCSYPSNNRFKHYGGRGIKVCPQWENSFEAFVADMGERPLGPTRFTLDRVDSNGDYTPENCRWATYGQQARNYGRNVILSLGGITQCLADWADEYCIPRCKARNRFVRAGWTLEEALEITKRR